jgi:choline dehydrogenase-like flavoprotein
VVSSDPYDKPRITSGYFSDPSGADLAALRRGIRAARQLAGAPALAKLVAEEVHPGPAVESDNDIEAYIKKYVCSGNALTGTCK